MYKGSGGGWANEKSRGCQTPNYLATDELRKRLVLARETREQKIGTISIYWKSELPKGRAL